ncbi:MAG: hypothetical protein FWF36_06600 [Propionibacteriaceae bacterium]|nr:hypothetical protein [Propionibacteriaceae bacterium]
MWLPDFLLPETSVGFGPVSKVVGGGVGVLLIAMASMALLPVQSGASAMTLAEVSSDWHQQVSDQATQLSAACDKAGQISVSDDVASDADVTAASKTLADVVTDSCAFGTLHKMQQAVFGEVKGSWTQDSVTELLNQGAAATTNLTNATGDLSNAISKAQSASDQAKLATALQQFGTQSTGVANLVQQAQDVLTDGTPLDPTTATNLKTEINTCNDALAADQTSLDALTAAVVVLQGCSTDLPNLTTALVASQEAYKQSRPTATKTTAAPAPPPAQTVQPQPPVQTQPSPPPTTNPVGRPPVVGQASVYVDNVTSITIQVYVTDPDHRGYSVCLFNGVRIAGQASKAGSQMVTASIAVSPTEARDPRAAFC